MFQINLLSYVVLALACAFAPDFATLVALRLLIGVGLGAELALVDSYLAELLPATHRGRLATRCYAFGMLAVPIAGALAALLPAQLWGASSWRWLLALSATGAIVIWVMRQRLPESPRWLVAQNRGEEALQTLARIEAAAGVPTTGSAAAVETPEPLAAAPAPVVAPRPRLLRPPLLGRTTLACLIEVLGPVAFYGFASIAPLVLLHKGFDVVESLGYSALSAIGYPLGSLLLVFVADRVQRRTLTIAASIGVAVTGTAFGLAESVWLIVLAGGLTTMLSVIQGTISRAYTAEMFPTAVRSTIIGRSYSLSRLVAAVLPFVLLPVLASLGAGVLYALCAVLILAMSLSVALLGPRTKRRPARDDLIRAGRRGGVTRPPRSQPHDVGPSPAHLMTPEEPGAAPVARRRARHPSSAPRARAPRSGCARTRAVYLARAGGTRAASSEPA